MKILIAPDSFKGSLTSTEVAMSIQKGIKKIPHKIETISIPVGDGGEGTVNSLVSATEGKTKAFEVIGPTGEKVKALYGILGGDQNDTCVIEMSYAAGINAIHPHTVYNPLYTTTYGVGQLIKHALNEGFTKFIIGLGGSITNDGGAGMLQALGAEILDSCNEQIGYGGSELLKANKINLENFDKRVYTSDFLIATDVQNPFVGINGASFVYGFQKGASEKEVKLLDNSLRHFAELIKDTTKISVENLEGAGAGGGIGGAFQAFFPSRIKQGIDVIIQFTGFKKHLSDVDLVITGEGQIDYQTLSGKTPLGIAQVAQENGVPTIILAGSIEGRDFSELYHFGVISVNSIMSKPTSLNSAMNNAAELLELTAEQVVRTYINIYKKNK